jgi:putative endonuclease
MAQHNTVGKQGEKLADAWLQQQGFDILHRNWRHSHYEIDIIAIKNDILSFIEVKTQNASPYTHPEEQVTRKKFRALQRAADEYLFRNPGYKWIQYHILAITLYPNRAPEYFLLEDVYL